MKKYYNKVKAVENLSLVIEKGEILALLGPNGISSLLLCFCIDFVIGAGKTTVLHVLTGLYPPTSGIFLQFITSLFCHRRNKDSRI